MRRLFWLVLGATLGVLIFRKLSAAAQKLTLQSIADSLGNGLTDLRAAAGFDSGSPDTAEMAG
jgi:hypothetical protein